MKRLALPLLAGLFAIPALAQPNLEITKKCPKLRYLGRDATLEIVVTNRGNAPAQNVVLTDTLTGGDFKSADNNGSRSGANVVWQLGTLAAGESRTFKMTVGCMSVGLIRSDARVTWCSEAVASCETECKGIPAILLECVDNPDPIEVGGQVTYTITVTNQGSETGTNIRITCTLPPEQEFVNATGQSPGTNDGRMVTFAPLATLASKDRAVWTVTTKGISAADSRFRIEMKSDQLEGEAVMETESTNIY